LGVFLGTLIILKITIRGHWGQVQHVDIWAVLNDVANVLVPHFDSPPREVTVKPGENAPMALFGANPTITLTARERYWSKYSYQFGHELCHILTNHNRLRLSPSGSYQVDEIICEAAGIYTVQRLAEKWVSNPPYPYLAGFAEHHRTYASETLRNYSAKPSGPIYSDPVNIPTDRARNGYVAIRLVGLLSANPEYWKATQSLPPPNPSVEDFFREWQKACPHVEAVNALITVLREDHQPTVSSETA
jgi:hypothetical protein